MIEASYNHLREFAPAVLGAIRFDGGTQARPLLRALEVLRELNATAGRRVPSDAATDSELREADSNRLRIRTAKR
jgi:hypothetical protein